LRVIRQELAAGRAAAPAAARKEGRPLRPASMTVAERGTVYPLEDVLEDTHADPQLVRELEEDGVIKGEIRAGVRCYDETEREIIRAVTELARHGVGGRNLRVFRTSADREAALLQQILAPALRSRNPEKRKEAIETLENRVVGATPRKQSPLTRA